MRKISAPLLLLFALALVLTGCGRKPQRYEPVSYGNPALSQCYYFHSPLEVDLLRQRGMCQPGWAPVMWPAPLRAGYYPYFSNDYYRRTYVPSSIYGDYDRQIGALRTDRNFQSQVAQESKRVKYKSNKGKIVTGNKVKTKDFGGRNQTGSGSRPKGCTSLGLNNDSVTVSGVAFTKGGSSGGGGRSGGSSGGGSRSGSSNSSKSTTNNPAPKTPVKQPAPAPAPGPKSPVKC